jgi:signal transduction histidine kinase/ketosteroid isomerase-like protein
MNKTMKLTKEQESEILQFHYANWEANLGGDMETFAACLDDDFSIFGSANGEVFYGKQEALAFYTATADQMKGKAQLRNRNISIQPLDHDCVIVRELSDLYVLIGEDWTFYGHCRLSCISRRTVDGWKLVHQHVSLPDHRTEEGEQIAAEKIEKENLELREAVKRRTAELEHKNRELAIEAALERVRARTMAMQHSQELAETSLILVQQIAALGIKTWGCAFNITDEAQGNSREWFSSAEGSMPMYRTPRVGIFKHYYEIGQRGETLHVEEISGKVCEDHYEFLCSLPVVGESLLAIKAAGGSFPSFQIDHVAYFKYGHLLFITFEHVPEAYDIFKRFAKAFEQTYTRFLDLQKAEEQTVKAEEDLIKLQTEKKRAEEALRELKAAQNQLIQSEKMASLGELTAGIAHEIQNPLNFVNNFSELSVELIEELSGERKKRQLQEKGQRNEELENELLSDISDNLQKITHHGQRASSIVKGMLEHSRKSTGEKEPADLNAMAEEYLRLAYHGLRAKDKSFRSDFKTYLDADLPKIYVVSQDFSRVLLNLISNAFYATRHTEKPEVKVTTKLDGDQALIRISDNGHGIPDAIKDKIFQPFFTTKPTGEGTGLGLSLAYDIIVKGHEGNLTVDSKAGEGSIFTISIPVSGFKMGKT